MANLPAERPKSSLTPVEAKALEMIAEGIPRTKVAQKLANGDKKKASYWRRRLKHLLNTEEAKAHAGMASHAIMVENLAPATLALARRARRGRPDAIKLLFEASGFHNPRAHTHEHSGEVTINLKGMPRPREVETTDSVVDAEVIEDD